MITYFVTTLLKRTYKYLLLTFFSIMVGTFLFGTILSISQSISSYFVSQGKVLIGGDIVLSSGDTIKTDSKIFESLENKGHVVTEQYSVDAVFKSATSDMTSVGAIRAVEENKFPLYGQVISDPANFSLQQGGLYAEQTFLNKLNLKMGDSVTIGEINLTILGVLIKEPDGISTGISFNPKIIMTVSDLNKTEIDLSQSRTNYKVFIKENIENPLSEAEILDLRNYAKDNKLRFDDASDGPNSLVRNLSSVQSFVGIVVAIALFLVVINIFANLTYLISKFKKTIALLKTFGATSPQIQIIYSIILGVVGLVAGIIGAFIGVLATNNILPLLSSYLNVVIPANPSLQIILLGGVIGLSIILTSALPFFSSLRKISPKQLINNSKDENNKSSILYYVPIPILLVVFLQLLSSDWKLVMYSIGGLIVSFGAFMLLSYIFLQILYKYKNKTPLIAQVSTSSLKYRRLEAIVIMSSIMTAFSGVFVISTIQQNIITNINQNISEKAPPLYLTDITTSQLENVKEIAGPTFKEYAIIRGRLLKLNNTDLTQSENRGITREFNMTYRNNLIAQEEIVKGDWHGDTNATRSVSIDQEFANEIGGVNIGDTIQVFVQGLTIQATVTSIRSTDRSSGSPFFYLVFSPDVLSKFPASYFGTVDTSDQEILQIENKLGTLYSNIIPIRTGTVIDTVNTLIATIVPIVKILGTPSIILGVLLVLVMTAQSLYERKTDVLILRAIGLNKNSIIKIFILEISSLIIFASIISYGLAHAIAYILNQYLFSFKIFTFAITPLYIILIIIIIVSIFAYIISQSIVNSPLKKLLAEK